MTFRSKMVTIQIPITERARQTLDRQASERGIAATRWAGQLFDAGFAAACAREKSMPIADGDLDAIMGAVLLLRAREGWDTATLAKAIGVPEPTVVRMLDAWRSYRAGSEAEVAAAKMKNDEQVATLTDAIAMDELLHLNMRKKFRQILQILVRSPKVFTPVGRLIDVLWADDPDGGPDDAEGLVHNHVSLMRRDILKPNGWTINASRGEGYRLERLQA